LTLLYKFFFYTICKFIVGVFIYENNDKKDNNYYFTLSLGVEFVFGMILNQIAIGLYLGATIRLALDYKKKK